MVTRAAPSARRGRQHHSPTLSWSPVTRAAPAAPAAPPSSNATLSGLTLSGIDFGAFAPGTISYTAAVANSVSQATVSPTPNHSGASYIIKLDGATDTDGVVALGVGGNVIKVEVTAQDGQTTRSYTVTVTRAVSESNRERLRDLYDSDEDGIIDRDEVFDAVGDYFDGNITKAEALEVITLYFIG